MSLIQPFTAFIRKGLYLYNMRRFIHTFLLLFLFIQGQGQNLVPNWSFEDTVGCPYTFSQIYFSPPWYSPTQGSPDYFNTCNSTTTSFGVPANAFGNQNPKTGQAYAGMYVFGISPANAREYIQVQLLDSMKAGKKYCVTFYTSLSDYSNQAISNLGLYISSQQVTSTSILPLPVTPQINNTNGYLINKVEWTLISGTYIAVGGEKYITIGNFLDDANTDTTSFGGINGQHAYYYIDDVTVEECPPDTFFIPNVFTPNGDGINDAFIISGSGIENINCTIYNRWGIKVASLSRTGEQWDGRTTSGQAAAEGVYYYVLQGRGEDGNDIAQTGFVQLLR
jgi:gliding motility-associated-like protein